MQQQEKKSSSFGLWLSLLYVSRLQNEKLMTSLQLSLVYFVSFEEVWGLEPQKTLSAEE